MRENTMVLSRMAMLWNAWISFGLIFSRKSSECKYLHIFVLELTDKKKQRARSHNETAANLLYHRQLLSFCFFFLQCENNIIKYCFPLVCSASLIVGLTIWRVFAGFFLVSATLHQCLWSNWKWHISNDTKRDMKLNAQDSGCVLEYFFSIPFFPVCFFKCMILVVYIFVNDNNQEILSSPKQRCWVQTSYYWLVKC